LIINAVGQDRLGIVSDITGMVIQNGGNVSDSQAAKLGNHFSLMMMVQVPTGSGTALKQQLSEMSDMNVSIFETPATEASVKTPHIACRFIFLCRTSTLPCSL
jgi:glycine cleavage system transcriptional repressor